MQESTWMHEKPNSMCTRVRKIRVLEGQLERSKYNIVRQGGLRIKPKHSGVPRRGKRDWRPELHSPSWAPTRAKVRGEFQTALNITRCTRFPLTKCGRRMVLVLSYSMRKKAHVIDEILLLYIFSLPCTSRVSWHSSCSPRRKVTTRNWQRILRIYDMNGTKQHK